jgi:hypothetical protein
MKLANPKLTLYAFHLRNDLSIGSDTPVENANHLWEKCQNLGEKLNVSDLKNFISNKLKKHNEIGVPPNQDYPEKDYLELLPERLLSFSVGNNNPPLRKTNPPLTGEIYPLQIHDTYAVDITLRYPETIVNTSNLAGLNPDGFFLPDKFKASLGQTLVFFAKPVENIKNYQELAEECIKNLLRNPKIEKISLTSGCFLGSPIFEYDNGKEKPGENVHILIWFNCYPITENKESKGEYYQLLINLLCCRSKILFAYSESRWCNQEAKSLYQKLKETVKEFDNQSQNIDKRLKLLKKILSNTSKDAFDYTRHLRDLEIHRATIKTNATNYKLYLDKLKQISVKERDDLNFLQEFFNHTHKKLIPQIQVDLDYLNSSRDLYSEIIDSIRGFIAIVQTESDRNLQIWLACVGSGLAVSSVSSQVINRPITTYLSKATEDKSPQLDNISYLFLDGMFHIGLGILVGVFAGCIAWMFTRYSNPKSVVRNKNG